MIRFGYISITCNGQCSCAISRERAEGVGAKIIHIFEISDSDLTIGSVGYMQGAITNINPRVTKAFRAPTSCKVPHPTPSIT